jgi:hypothetical protein
MDKLTDYIVHNKGFLSTEVCDAITKELGAEDYPWESHLYSDENRVQFSRDNGELKVGGHIPDAAKDIMFKLKEPLAQYVQGIGKMWGSWQGYVSIRFNRYEEGTSMVNHIDHIDTLFEGDRKGIPILSIVGCLSTPIKGGEFIMFNNTKINLEKGDLLLFPSIFLYPHKVTPILEGTRTTFVSWVW